MACAVFLILTVNNCALLTQVLRWTWSYDKLDALYEQLVQKLINREQLWASGGEP